MLVVVALRVPEPARLILLLAAVALGGLLLQCFAAASLRTRRTRRNRRYAAAENHRGNAQIIARYEQELKDTQARYREHPADQAEDTGPADLS